MKKRPIRQISEAANTDWNPISLNQSQSVAKLASHGTRMSAKKSPAIIPSATLLKDFGRGGNRAGPGRSNGDVMSASKCHPNQPPASGNDKGIHRMPLFQMLRLLPPMRALNV